MCMPREEQLEYECPSHKDDGFHHTQILTVRTRGENKGSSEEGREARAYLLE